MAFNSRQCVLCKDPTKRKDGKYYGKDEKGTYSGPMYTCDNPNCSVSCERRRSQKQVMAFESTKNTHRKNNS